MTAADAPSPYVASAIDYGEGMEPWEAFDGSTELWHNWKSTTSIYSEPVWLKIDLGSNKTAASYVIRAVTDYWDRAPRTWYLHGSTNDSDWTLLDSQADLAFSSGTPYRTMSTASPGAYRYYKLTCHTALYNGNEPYVGE